MSEHGLTFFTFIARELETERERRRTFDARGAAVVTVSGSLAALLAAVGAFVASRAGFSLPDGAVWPLTLTLLAFAVAAAFGLTATFPWKHEVTDEGTLNLMLTERWPMTDEVDARNLVATQDVKTITSLRKGNEWKARLLIAALVSQVVGLVTLTLAVYRVLQAAS